MAGLNSIARHDLVWYDPRRRAALLEPLAAAGNEADAAVLGAWLDAGRPFVISRQPPGLPGGHLAAGLPLPPSQGKRRIAVHLPKAGILRQDRPPSLREASAAAPAAWREGLSALLAMEAQGLPMLRVYGSLAWQYLTGLAYVGPASDLDLLWDAQPAPARRRMCEALRQWQQAYGIPVDGEMCWGQGRAVSWREWMRVAHAGAGPVLVKHLHGAWLCESAALEQPMPEMSPC